LHLTINENKKNALDTGHSITKGNIDCISKVIVIVMLYVPWKTITEKKKKKSESFSCFTMQQIND
jgi:hypothetical protein